jgi:hypothetical integral membrane protein (TIGR02206 family)
MHYAIPLGSTLWLVGFIGSLAFIVIPIGLARNRDEVFQKKTGRVLGALLLVTAFGRHLLDLYNNSWNLESSLPLHMCGISGLLAGLIFFWHSQLAFEILVFWGLAGAFHSIITPELTRGFSVPLTIEYYIVHAGIIAASLFLFFVQNKTIRKRSWLKIFLITQPVLLLVGTINYLTGGNYMYLCKKPIAENPLLFGDWPWYILGFQIAGIIHFWLIYALMKKLGKVEMSS